MGLDPLAKFCNINAVRYVRPKFLSFLVALTVRRDETGWRSQDLSKLMVISRRLFSDFA